MMARTFLKLMDSPVTELVAMYPDCLALAYQIAVRARNDGSRQALVGDWAALGMTEKRYRTAKERLEQFGFARFDGKPNVGTVATLLTDEVFDLSPFADMEGGMQGGIEGGIEGGIGASATNERATVCAEGLRAGAECRAELRAEGRASNKDLREKEEREYIYARVDSLLSEERFQSFVQGDFRRLFRMWVDYRMQKKYPPPAQAFDLELEDALDVGAEAACRMIRQAIKSGWNTWMYLNNEDRQRTRAAVRSGDLSWAERRSRMFTGGLGRDDY